MASAAKDTLFGYEIPMPLSDLLTALITVALFLPVTVIVYRIIRAVYDFSKRKQT